MSLLFAFIAAFLSALTAVTQHVASTGAPVAVKGWRLAFYLVRNRLWLLGVAATGGSFAFQAWALYDGRLSVVQSILIAELVFTLLITRVWLGQSVSATAWMAASLTSVGLIVFLTMSEPQGGHPQATSQAWLPALTVFGAITVVCVVLARGGSPTRRAAFYALGSAITAALLATFLKSSTDTLADSGVLTLLARGPVYGLIAAGIVNVLLTQAALHVGPLVVSQPLMVIVNPFVSVVLGVWLYGEHFAGGPAQIGVAVVGFVAMIVGVVALARTSPPPSPPRTDT